MAKRKSYTESSEVRSIRSALKKVRFPKGIANLDFDLGNDSTGDPAVWIWIVVKDAAADVAASAETATRLSRDIRQALHKAGSDRWPYLSFRTVSEQKELQAARR